MQISVLIPSSADHEPATSGTQDHPPDTLITPGFHPSQEGRAAASRRHRRVVPSSMFSTPRILVHMEGGTILVTSLLLYRHQQAGWLLFSVLFLAPDLFMVGYIFNPRAGAAIYNSVHSLISPGIFLAICFFAGKSSLLPFALIWTAHIGLDRLLGYGLKYPTNFKDTHLQHL